MKVQTLDELVGGIFALISLVAAFEMFTKFQIVDGTIQTCISALGAFMFMHRRWSFGLGSLLILLAFYWWPVLQEPAKVPWWFTSLIYVHILIGIYSLLRFTQLSWNRKTNS